MAIHHEVKREGSEGIEKMIDSAALGMIFDNVQKHQYEYPEKSTIRELFANSNDAIREKLNAMKIIRGQAKPEDFYIERDEPLYWDSNWMPEYWDIDWLSPDQNRVRIEFHYAEMGRDTIKIMDYGSGIGHIVNPKSGNSRLMGVLKLG